MELELHIVKDPCRDYGKSRKRVFGVEGGSICRAPDSYWVLPDPKCYVSGRHCVIGFPAIVVLALTMWIPAVWNLCLISV